MNKMRFWTNKIDILQCRVNSMFNLKLRKCRLQIYQPLVEHVRYWFIFAPILALIMFASLYIISLSMRLYIVADFYFSNYQLCLHFVMMNFIYEVNYMSTGKSGHCDFCEVDDPIKHPTRGFRMQKKFEPYALRSRARGYTVGQDVNLAVKF